MKSFLTYIQDKIKPLLGADLLVENELYQYNSDAHTSICLVFLLDRSAKQISDFLSDADALIAKFDKCIFVVTCENLVPFTSRSLIAEVFPRIGSYNGVANKTQIRAFLTRRYELIYSKWSPKMVLTFGVDFEDYMALMSPTDKIGISDEFGN